MTGRGNVTAMIALVAYTLLIIFRNILTGLDNVPDETKDAGRGMGLTDRQLLWRVELPLALPEIFAGLRIAVTTTVGLATLAFFAGAGGLGEQIFADINFKSNVVVAGGLAVLLAVVLDAADPARSSAAITPWTRTAHDGTSHLNDSATRSSSSSTRASRRPAARRSAARRDLELMWTHMSCRLRRDGASRARSPSRSGCWLGHIGAAASSPSTRRTSAARCRAWR